MSSGTPLEGKTIAVIGCGNLGLSMVRGWVAHEALQPDQIWATRRSADALAPLEELRVHTSTDNSEAVAAADIIVLAVKPYKYEEVLSGIRGALDPDRHVLVSALTGVSLSQLLLAAGKPVPVLRAMPNTATGIGESMTCIAHTDVDEAILAQVRGLFELLGRTVVINEELMEAATVLGACGIAYVMRFIRSMVQGGIQIGFDAPTANLIATQTVKGAAELLLQGGRHPEEEIDKVTTPKGCTIVGLNEMEHQGFSSALIRGIIASFEKISD